MSQQPTTNIEDFINALEEMIDARDDMWEEEKYSNYRQMNLIKEERYEPAKNNVRKSLKKFIKEIIKNNS